MKRRRTSEGLGDGIDIPDPLVFVEFYAGVGGWSFALNEAMNSIFDTASRPKVECAAAWDHSDLCVNVYRHNHGDVSASKVMTRGIENLSVRQLASMRAHIFFMSPPCQPHSRQHSNQERDLQDPRSKSFLHLCHLLEELPTESLPKILLLENVLGFETSNSCQLWRRVLASRNYRTGHFHLQPTQVGLPNDRPRYYTVALLNDGVGKGNGLSPLEKYFVLEAKDAELKAPKLHTSLVELGVAQLEDESLDHTLPTIQELLELQADTINTLQNNELCIPDKILSSNAAWCLDFVSPTDRRSACFTSSYGKYCRGTGSVLYTGSKPILLKDPQEREFDQNWSQGINLKTDARYFSGLEMARFFGFPPSFSFPDQVNLKQQWKLMGNSLNARVAGRLVELALRVGWGQT